MDASNFTLFKVTFYFTVTFYLKVKAIYFQSPLMRRKSDVGAVLTGFSMRKKSTSEDIHEVLNSSYDYNKTF